jgi:hypothetical protein
MTFRKLSTGVLFHFAQYDDPWSRTDREGALWRKINNNFYVGSSSRQSRTAIDDTNRAVWAESKLAVR